MSGILHRYAVLPLTAPDMIRAFLNRDRTLTAYLLGDLDPAYWSASEYIGAFDGGVLAGVVLFYRGLEPTIITAYGSADAVRAVLDATALPCEMYTLMPPELGDVIAGYYRLHDPHTEWRMVLDADAFTAPRLDAVTRIQPGQAEQLAALYAQAAGPGEAVIAFSPAQIARGVFYGVWAGDVLVATAGTHVWSVVEHVAAIGNVFTHPDYRGRGYATQVTAAVVRDALAAGIDPVVLNVRYGNEPAIHVYEKLGFRRSSTFLEGPGLRR